LHRWHGGKGWINRARVGILPGGTIAKKGSPMSANPVLWDLDQRGVATVTLNRPEVNNA